MSVDPDLRSLDIDIPSSPQSLVQLSLLLAAPAIDLPSASALIETDMALAAATMKAVNSSLYGLKGRVQSVQQAMTYLGLREVAAIIFEMGLRAVFPPSPELQPLWDRAARRGLLMGRLAQRLGQDAWAAHSAGLFEECGKAVLIRHSAQHYGAMMRAANGDVELVALEHAGFGVSHDALGAALCESWGLGQAAVACVRHHVGAQAGGPLPEIPSRRPVCALSVVAHSLLTDAQGLDAAVQRVAGPAGMDPAMLAGAAREVAQALLESAADGA
jgi:HD-like signal output (HDOD) protein